MNSPYGRYHWGLITIKIDKSYETNYLNADEVEVKEGDIIFYTNKKITFCVARGHWKYFFSASIIDGRAMASDRELEI